MRVAGFGSKVQISGLGFGVSGFLVSGCGFRVSVFGFRFPDFKFRDSDFGLRVQGPTSSEASRHKGPQDPGMLRTTSGTRPAFGAILQSCEEQRLGLREGL